MRAVQHASVRKGFRVKCPVLRNRGRDNEVLECFLSVIRDLQRMNRVDGLSVTSKDSGSFRETTCLPLLLLQIKLRPVPSSFLLYFTFHTLLSLQSCALILLFLHFFLQSHFLFLSFFCFVFQIVICGQRNASDTAGLLAAVNSLFLPFKVNLLTSYSMNMQRFTTSFNFFVFSNNNNVVFELHNDTKISVFAASIIVSVIQYFQFT